MDLVRSRSANKHEALKPILPEDHLTREDREKAHGIIRQGTPKTTERAHVNDRPYGAIRRSPNGAT